MVVDFFITPNNAFRQKSIIITRINLLMFCITTNSNKMIISVYI